jgi:hypothetical protein
MDIEIATANDSLASDLLRGARAISAFTGEDEKKVYRGLALGYIPAGKEGAEWVASKRVLREHYARLTQGTVNQPPRPEPRIRRASRPPPLRRRRARPAAETAAPPAEPDRRGRRPHSAEAPRPAGE